MIKIKKVLQRKEIIYILVIICLAFFLRLRYIMITPFKFKIDAWSMYHYALNVMNGKGYDHCFGEHWSRYAYWPPLYIYLTGFVYRIFGMQNHFFIMRFIQVIFSTASPVIVYFITKESSKNIIKKCEEAGLLAAIIMSINPRMVIYTNHLYVETVFIFLYLLTCYFGIRYYRDSFEKSKKYLILFAVALGITNLVRPVVLFIPGVMIVANLIKVFLIKIPLKKGFKTLIYDNVLIVAIMLLIFTPWIIRNHNVTGRFILIDTNGPINFYMAHNPRANGGWVDVKPYKDINKLYTTGYKDGLNYMLHNKKKEVRLLGIKEYRFLFAKDTHEVEDGIFVKKTLGFIPRISFEILWIVCSGVFILMIIKLIKSKKLKFVFLDLSFIIGNIIYIALIILAFYFTPRYRVIIEPFLTIIFGVSTIILVSKEKNML